MSKVDLVLVLGSLILVVLLWFLPLLRWLPTTTITISWAGFVPGDVIAIEGQTMTVKAVDDDHRVLTVEYEPSSVHHSPKDTG